MNEDTNELMKKLRTEFFQFQAVSDIGIDSFSDSIKLLDDSVEEIRNDQFSNDVIERMKKYANRSLSIYKDRVLKQIKICGFLDIDQGSFKSLNKQLLKSIYDLIRDLSLYDPEYDVITSEEIIESVLEVKNQTKDMTKFLNFLKNESRDRMNQILDSGSVTENHEELREQVDLQIPNSMLVGDNNDETRNLSENEPENRLASGTSSIMGNDDVMENLSPNHDINNQSSRDLPNSVVRILIPNFSKILYEPQDIETVIIGSIPWKIVCHLHGNYFRIVFVCEQEKPNFTCVAKTKIRFLEHIHHENYDETINTHFWNDETKKSHVSVELRTLTWRDNGYIKNDTIITEFDFDILETSGIPTPDDSFLHSEYDRIVGNVTYTFPNVSSLARNEELMSDDVYIGGFPWRLAMNHEAIYTFFNVGEHLPFLSCDTKVNFCVMCDGKSVYSKTMACTFSKFQCAELQNSELSWGNLMKNKRLLLKDDEVTVIATITIYRRRDQ